MATAAHHRGSHKRIAKLIVQTAYTNPCTRCWQCLRTLDKCGPLGDGRNRNGTPCTWQAGHVVDSDSRYGYLPECSHCNATRGAELGNTLRGRRWILSKPQRAEPHTERW